MVLELKVKNFRSIKDWQSFTMLSENKIKELSDSIFNVSDYKVLTSSLIYGRNASGKSNLIRAFKVIEIMVLRSSDFKLDEKIPMYDPFLLDSESTNSPVEIELDFIAKDKLRYNYAIGFTETKITYEILRFYPKSQPATLFERIDGNKKIKYGEYFTGPKKEIESRLYSNQLFLSKVGTEKIEPLIEAYKFFTQYLFVSDYHESRYDDSLIKSFARKMANTNNETFKKNVISLIKMADTGIDDIVVVEDDTQFNFPASFDEKKRTILIEHFKYEIKTTHKVFKNNEHSGNVLFPLSEESTGTNKLLVVGGLIIDALETGQVLIIDELDKSLHSKLSSALIQLFSSKKTNPHNAQLIFATHDVSLLDNEIFRRDQIWFAEKQYEGHSQYYSLSDIAGIRANIPYEKWYMGGRFGGIPVLNSSALNLEF